MDLSNITRLISSMRVQTAKDSITPNGLGSILQRIVDAISSMSGIDVEDENAILQRLSTAESDAETALQTAQNAQTGVAGNVIDSFTTEQDIDEVTLSLKQHGYAAKQVVLPAASSTGAGIMTATDKSHLETAYSKRVTLMNTLSSAAEVTLQLTFGDGSTKVVTFVGASAGNGGKAGLMTKEQADQLAALVAAGTAESVRDDAGYIKQQYAAPVVLRNVSDEEVDDLSVGDIFYDAGNLWQCGASENTDMGAPSKKVIYYCLADQMLYRWTGSRFVQAVRISGDIAVPTKLSDLINDMGFLTAHQSLKTINGQTITGTGNITIDGAAELKDASNHIKQSMAAPMVLRNVTNEEVDDLSEGDVFFDSGVLWYCGASGNVSLGNPSKSLIYYCRGDQKFYRWTGSSFTAASSQPLPSNIVQSVSVNGQSPVTPDGNGNVNIEVQTGGETVVINSDGANIVDSHTNNSVLVAGSARQVKMLYDNIMQIFNNLGNYAFPNGKPTLNWIGTFIQHTLSYTLNGCKADVTAGQVNEGLLQITLTPNNASMAFTSVQVNNKDAAWTPSGESDGSIYLDVLVNQNITVSATAVEGYSVSLGSGSSNVTLYGSSALPNKTYHGRIDADANYDRPAGITATMNGNAVDFTASGNSYTQATGEIVIANVTGPIVITAQADAQASITLALPNDPNIICKHGTEVLGASVTVYSGMMPYVVTIEPAEGCHFTSVPSVGGTALPNSGEIYTLTIPAGSTSDITVTASAVSANALFSGVRWGESSAFNYLYVGEYENWAVSPLIDVENIDTLKFLISGASAAPAGIIMFNAYYKSLGRVTADVTEKTAVRGTGGFVQGTKYVRLQMPVSMLTDANAEAYVTDGNGNYLWRLSTYAGGVATADDFLASEYNTFPQQANGAWIGWALAPSNNDWNKTTNHSGTQFWSSHFSMVCKPNANQITLEYGLSPLQPLDSKPSSVTIGCNSSIPTDSQKGGLYIADANVNWGWWLQSQKERTINTNIPDNPTYLRLLFLLGTDNEYLGGNGTFLKINGTTVWIVKSE